ncbi:MAG: hypothetical protein OIF55_17630 [Amphritea sp.]|nr:hypothetical protein [Amphritea sp.]
MFDDIFPDDLFDASSYEAESPIESKEFLPWHRPRKQLVRKQQWLEHINRLAKYCLNNGNQLKYLGLPGSDLLDIRYLHDNFCLENEISLSFLGFNNGAPRNAGKESNLNISLSEVRNLQYIDDSSIVLNDDIKNIARINSYAHQQAIKKGPFDVVNFDLCDSIAQEAPNNLGTSHYATINQILAIQAKATSPWLLLLTTRIGSTHVHDEVQQKLIQLFKDNFNNNEQFREKSSDYGNLNSESDIDMAEHNEQLYSNILAISICKWILTTVLDQPSQPKVELVNVMGYTVDQSAEHMDLISIAIKFTPSFAPQQDFLGLSSVSDCRLEEGEVASKFIKRVFQSRNCDEVLSEDSTLMQQMVDEMKLLLEKSRYDVTHYDSWAT